MNWEDVHLFYAVEQSMQHGNCPIESFSLPISCLGYIFSCLFFSGCFLFLTQIRVIHIALGNYPLLPFFQMYSCGVLHNWFILQKTLPYLWWLLLTHINMCVFSFSWWGLPKYFKILINFLKNFASVSKQLAHSNWIIREQFNKALYQGVVRVQGNARGIITHRRKWVKGGGGAGGAGTETNTERVMEVPPCKALWFGDERHRENTTAT